MSSVRARPPGAELMSHFGAGVRPYRV